MPTTTDGWWLNWRTHRLVPILEHERDIRMPEIAKRLTDLSFEAGESSPAEMAVFMKQERERWGTVIRAIGATAE